MNQHSDSRASRRVPIGRQVQIVTKGRTAFYALAINVGIGGLLLSASQALPVGSLCGVVVPQMKGAPGDRLLLEGTVIRNDAFGVALQFANQLEGTTVDAMARVAGPAPVMPLVTAYLNYFKVSQRQQFEGSQHLLGVSPRVFRTVFLITFSASFPLAIAPVWLAREIIQPYPTALKILLSFGYAALWFAVLQPMADLFVFRFLRNHRPSA